MELASATKQNTGIFAEKANIYSEDGKYNEAFLQEFAQLMAHICNLYTLGESSSVSESEAYDLAASAVFVLEAGSQGKTSTLPSAPNISLIALWTKRRKALEARIPHVKELWQQAVDIMPPIRNIAARDTLLSIEQFPNRYDTFFAAHEIPCSIDYPLSIPISDSIQGLDYVEAWLIQFIAEAQFLTQFNVDEMTAYLDLWCPDYRGLLINLYEPIYEAWTKGIMQVASR